MRQNNEADYNEELDKINLVEVDLNDKQRKLIDYDDKIIGTIK